MQYLTNKISSNKVELVVIKVDLEKGQEVMKKCMSIIKANVYKEMQTWAVMAKEVKA